MSAGNLTLLAYEPLSEQGLYARDFFDDITENHDSYTHIIKALGGFDKANFNIKGTRDYLEEWFADGLMRRVVMLNPEGLTAWEGYVSRIILNVGTLQRTKSVENMFNRVYMIFSPIDVSTAPVGLSEETTNLVFNHLPSQADFGIKATVIKGGEITHGDAFDWSRTILDSRGDIQIGENITTSSKNTLNIKIEAKGYWHTLEWLPYINDAAVGEIQAHQVISEILEFFNEINPGWISTNFNLMDYNFRLERRGADEFKTCLSLIKDIINRGGSGGERWVGGIYDDRQFIYKAAEDFNMMYGDDSFLIRELKDKAQRIFDQSLDAEVKPWDLRPDQILRTTDL